LTGSKKHLRNAIISFRKSDTDSNTIPAVLRRNPENCGLFLCFIQPFSAGSGLYGGEKMIYDYLLIFPFLILS